MLLYQNYALSVEYVCTAYPFLKKSPETTNCASHNSSNLTINDPGDQKKQDCYIVYMFVASWLLLVHPLASRRDAWPLCWRKLVSLFSQAQDAGIQLTSGCRVLKICCK